MKKYTLYPYIFLLITGLLSGILCHAQPEQIIPTHKVTLKESHVGNLDIDTRLLDSYGFLPDNVREFYFASRSIFTKKANADFTHPQILKEAKSNGIELLGGPMLGQLGANQVVLWMRPASQNPIHIRLKEVGGDEEILFTEHSNKPGVVKKLILDELKENTKYRYEVNVGESKTARGSFSTAPIGENKGTFRITFGSCFHKIGLHNPNLIQNILEREPNAMMLLGDLAVDDREDNINMHRSDYLLRDISAAWQSLASNVPLYATWDDHDYLNNDLSGIPERFDEEDRTKLREVWSQNWNNPEHPGEGIYFNTRIGPVEIIMLDTRSCRTNKERGKYGSYLGLEQQNWLKETLLKSTAPFKIVSSGTMWSDYVTKAKDSWGSWDTEAREEIFSLIQKNNVSGVLFVSGDRHGARGFTIPRPTGFNFYEFEAGSLGGVPGPDAMAPDTSKQLFGYHGEDAIAFGEFTFDTTKDQAVVTFRLIDQFGKIMEEILLPYEKLSPKNTIER